MMRLRCRGLTASLPCTNCANDTIVSLRRACGPRSGPRPEDRAIEAVPHRAGSHCGILALLRAFPNQGQANHYGLIASGLSRSWDSLLLAVARCMGERQPTSAERATMTGTSEITHLGAVPRRQLAGLARSRRPCVRGGATGPPDRRLNVDLGPARAAQTLRAGPTAFHCEHGTWAERDLGYPAFASPAGRVQGQTGRGHRLPML
jgi:hypothetical protein